MQGMKKKKISLNRVALVLVLILLYLPGGLLSLFDILFQEA